MDNIDKIRLRQVLTYGPERLKVPLPPEPPRPQVEILYMGCIEARLDPHKHIGLPPGRTMIHRMATAFVNGVDEDGKARDLGEAADVQLAVNKKKVKHIIVSAHTKCAGLQACMDGCDHPDTNFVHEYLKPLEPVREAALARHPHDSEASMHALEEGTVKKSLENLMTYPFVRQAVERGDLQLHGWVLDIDTKQISEMDPETGKFEPMATKYAAMANEASAKRWVQSLRAHQRGA